MFELHPNLQKKHFIIDFALSTVLLEDEKNYPWVLLVPRREKISCLIDLPLEEQLQLMRELDFVQRKMKEHFLPKQLNVAAIGNKTDQLHVHVICRYLNDPAWPATVWDHPARQKFTDDERQERIAQLRGILTH